MATPSVEDGEEAKIVELSGGYFAQGDHIKALEVIEDYILSHRKKKVPDLLYFQQGQIFAEQAGRTERNDVKFAFGLGSVESFSVNDGFSSFCAFSLFSLGSLLGSSLYFKKTVERAKEYLSIVASFRSLKSEEQKSQSDMESILKAAESRIADAKALVASPLAESKEMEETSKSDSDFVKGLRSYWAGLTVERKKDFMKVSIADFGSYVERLYGAEGRDALKQFLTHASGEEKRWRFWLCRICSEKFFSGEKCKNHLEQEHDAEYKPPVADATAQRIGIAWRRKISERDWEPVDAADAVGMIKNQLKDVKAFACKNGWSKDWPIAEDEDRSKLLQEIRNLLVSFCDRKILSCSVRDWVMRFVDKRFEKFGVSKDSLTECHLVGTPQSICFLDCHELSLILEYLKNVKCARDDGTDLVSRAVDSFYCGTQVKESIDFDKECSYLLLDKRLLQCKIARFDDEGTISFFVDPNAHYAKAHAHGDDILSWLTDQSSGDERFRFPRTIRAHNLDIWLAVLRAVQFTCRTLGAQYSKKLQILGYDEVLTEAKKLCISEDERRMNIPEDQWNIYASLLCDELEKLTTGATDSLSTAIHLSAVQDVLKEVSHPSFDFSDLADCQNVIRDCKNVSDDLVLKSIDHLKAVVTRKVSLTDSKILLIENSRIRLLEDLTRLSVFDYRSYILRPLKEFLLAKIVEMESKAKIAAAEAEFLLVDEKQPQSKKKRNQSNKVDTESKAKAAAADAYGVLAEEKKSQSKKKKNKSKKRTSTSMSSPLNKTVEHEKSGNVELEGTSLTPKIGEGDYMEPDNTLSSEMGRVKISSNTDNQEEAAKDLQNMPGEDSLPKHLEPAQRAGAIRYNSTLDVTLKALCNIKVLKEYLVHNRHQFADNQEEKVPSALRNFFTAFVSKEIKEDGIYGCLLEDLLASLEEVDSMSSDAAELLVSILEFWPCWKSPEIESVVTRLFTLEEYERMSCSKCGKKPNNPEKSSYRIVVAADSVRDLKCAFGNIKFEEILKLIRMEDKMLCDTGTGGCGKKNFVHHIMSKCPPIFTVVLEWEKDETEKEISETAKALEWEIDMSRLYEGLEQNKQYRLVSMVGCGPCGEEEEEEEEEEHICLAYKKNRWVSFRREASGKEVVGNWTNVVRFCGERKVRPKILFYESFSKV